MGMSVAPTLASALIFASDESVFTLFASSFSSASSLESVAFMDASPSTVQCPVVGTYFAIRIDNCDGSLLGERLRRVASRRLGGIGWLSLSMITSTGSPSAKLPSEFLRRCTWRTIALTGTSSSSLSKITVTVLPSVMLFCLRVLVPKRTNL
eukprot:21050_2